MILCRPYLEARCSHLMLSGKGSALSAQYHMQDFTVHEALAETAQVFFSTLCVSLHLKVYFYVRQYVTLP